MKYKPGDTVLIRSDLVCHGRYYMENDSSISNTVVEEMFPLCGTYATISSIVSGQYLLVESEEYFLWTDGMFEDDSDFPEGCDDEFYEFIGMKVV